MTFNLAALTLLITVMVMVMIVWTRAVDCRSWRKKEHNRRKEALTYEGPDRRRCATCPHTIDYCAAVGLFEEPK